MTIPSVDTTTLELVIGPAAELSGPVGNHDTAALAGRITMSDDRRSSDGAAVTLTSMAPGHGSWDGPSSNDETLGGSAVTTALLSRPLDPRDRVSDGPTLDLAAIGELVEAGGPHAHAERLASVARRAEQLGISSAAAEVLVDPCAPDIARARALAVVSRRMTRAMRAG